MGKPLASLTEVRLNRLALDSGMNSGADVIEGDVSFSISAKTTFNIGGEKREQPYVMCRVAIDAQATLNKADQLLDMKAEFIGRYEFDEHIEDDRAEELIKDHDYCELITLQLQSFVNAKFIELVNLIGLEVPLPLNLIRVGPPANLVSAGKD